QEFVTLHKNIGSLVKLLTEISRLKKDQINNLPQLKMCLKKLEGILGQFNRGIDQYEALRHWIDTYKRDLDAVEEQVRMRFGIELEQELKKIGLSLSGQYPELRAGFFTIELDFAKWRVTLWYGPKQERLDRCHLSSVEVANYVDKVRQQLGSHMSSEDEFLKKLEEAYFRTAGRERGTPVPIIRVLPELAYLLQSPRFYQDSKKEDYKSYSRADFSYDLFQVRHEKRLHLTVATRAYTKQRQDFLWVPDDESGRGTTYSHLQFREAT
ncbi:MAG: hypothetical protein HY709_00075, partial [Candidatus Latescibacteria bacterium]|nr:hypothetical protein [Candidatus Latescibacterota bacterium]